MSCRTSGRQWVLIAVLTGSALVVLVLLAINWSPPASAQGVVLSISKSADPVHVHPGNEMTYTITFTNTGASGFVSMVDVIPFGVTYVPGSATGGAVYMPSPPARVVWSGTMAPGSRVVTFRVEVEAPGTLGPFPIVNQACVNDTTCDSTTVSSTRVKVYLPITTKNYSP